MCMSVCAFHSIKVLRVVSPPYILTCTSIYMPSCACLHVLGLVLILELNQVNYFQYNFNDVCSASVCVDVNVCSLSS